MERLKSNNQVLAYFLQARNFVPAFTCNLSHVMGEKQLQAIDSKDQEIPLFPFIYSLKKAYLLSKKYAKNALENKKINSLQMALGCIQAPFFLYSFASNQAPDGPRTRAFWINEPFFFHALDQVF